MACFKRRVGGPPQVSKLMKGWDGHQISLLNGELEVTYCLHLEGSWWVPNVIFKVRVGWSQVLGFERSMRGLLSILERVTIQHD